MRKWPFVLVLVCLLLGSGVVSAGDAPAKARQFQIDLSVRQGDPLGSPEAGSLEVLAERKLITSEKQAAKFVQGAEETIGDEVIRIGRTIRVTPERAEKGQIRLDVVMKKTDLLEESEDTAQWQTTQSRYARWLKPGQVLKLRWGKVSGQQTWVELTVCEVGQ